MRHSWACPDLGLEVEPGRGMPIPGSFEAFPECPAAYLRTQSEVSELRIRRRLEPFAPHLIDGVVHPATIVSIAAHEIESGSRNSDELSNKVMTLVSIHMREKAARDRHDSEIRKEHRGDR